MAIQQALVAVPARFNPRLPNKVLADIGGKPMIQQVLERCREAEEVDAVVPPTMRSCSSGRKAGVPAMTAESAVRQRRIASVADARWRWGDQPVANRRVINVQGISRSWIRR